MTVHSSLTQMSSTARCDLTTAYVSPCCFSSFQLLTTLTTFWTENPEMTRHCYTPALRLSINPCGQALKGGENTWPFLVPPRTSVQASLAHPAERRARPPSPCLCRPLLGGDEKAFEERHPECQSREPVATTGAENGRRHSWISSLPGRCACG